jgi:hypothetical protein
MTVARH